MPYNRLCVHITAIIPAAGLGARFGGSQPKQLIALGGRPILQRAIEVFLAHPRVTDVVVALPRELADQPPAYLRGTPKPIQVVEGGARRQDSVACAFEHASRRADLVVIHDAARPLVSADLVSQTIDAAVEHGAAIAAVPATDTVKRSNASRVVIDTLPRAEIFLAQTPQAFRVAVLRDALTRVGRSVEVTDEARLVELAGYPVKVVEGDPRNIKITTPEDLAVAERMLGPLPKRSIEAGSLRIGAGYDLHVLVPGRRLVLGGVAVPFEKGLQGHSDADVVCHAAIDAILGGAGAGDIGRHFPDTDPAWKDADSTMLLRRAVEIVRRAGYAIVNVDVVVIAERPRLAPHVPAMQEKLAEALGVAPDRVSVKGKTNEGVDATGTGAAIAAHAVALLRGSGVVS
jgi:2-C-methyl-D-erythritol 4-phosphate cytidylyltransferase/2-C-methyl-D-erythritol 2,4-cyclodiphosphate synthase